MTNKVDSIVNSIDLLLDEMQEALDVNVSVTYEQADRMNVRLVKMRNLVRRFEISTNIGYKRVTK